MALEEGASPRTQERMDNLVTCNPSGLPGGGLFRDKVIECVVRSVKTKLRHLYTSMKDQIIDKAVASLSTIGRIADHDLLSMGKKQLMILILSHLREEKLHWRIRVEDYLHLLA